MKQPIYVIEILRKSSVVNISQIAVTVLYCRRRHVVHQNSFSCSSSVLMEPGVTALANVKIFQQACMRGKAEHQLCRLTRDDHFS